jgi:hypothetical protein
MLTRSISSIDANFYSGPRGDLPGLQSDSARLVRIQEALIGRHHHYLTADKKRSQTQYLRRLTPSTPLYLSLQLDKLNDQNKTSLSNGNDMLTKSQQSPLYPGLDQIEAND